MGVKIIKFSNFIKEPLYDHLVKANVYLVQIKIGEYLKLVDLKENPFQRNVLEYDIYLKLIKDMLSGAIFPPISVVYPNKINLEVGMNDDSKFMILDGLQRTNCLINSALILSKEIDLDVPTIYKTPKEFLDRLITLEIWEGLDLKSILYKIIVLNTGQKRMDARHQLDIMTSFLKDFLKEKSIDFIELKEKIEDETTSSELQKKNKFPLYSIAEGIVAYVNKFPQFAQRSTIEFLFNKLDLEPGSYKEGIKIIEDENTYLDLVWTLKEFSDSLLKKYGYNILIKYPLFLASFLAAMGYVRSEFGEKIEERKKTLIDLLSKDEEDPLNIESYKVYYNEFQSNIGAKRRKLVFIAFKNFFSSPVASKMDWLQAFRESK